MIDYAQSLFLSGKSDSDFSSQGKEGSKIKLQIDHSPIEIHCAQKANDVTPKTTELNKEARALALILELHVMGLLYCSFHQPGSNF